MVSVIVPTYNGAHKVLNTLKALEQQTYQDFETIVVIDGSTDNTIRVLSEAKLSLRSLKIIQQENKGRAAVRNKGAQEASGDLLIFFDDDIRPIAECVALHVAHHSQKSGSILAGNPMEELALSHTDIYRYKASLSRKWLEPLRKHQGALCKENLFLSAANFSVPKKVFLQVGGFDERLTDAEDFHFATKAYEQNILIFFSYEAIGWHDDFITCNKFIHRRREYNMARQQLLQLRPSLKPYLSDQTLTAVRWKRLLYSFFAKNIWVKMVDCDAFTFLPRRIRYWIYSMIIWGMGVYYPERKL